MENRLEGIITRYQENEGNLISILQDIESEFGYLREDAINWVSERLDVPPAKFYGIATFYAQFHLKPKGKNVITACCGTAFCEEGGARTCSFGSGRARISPTNPITGRARCATRCWFTPAWR